VVRRVGIIPANARHGLPLAVGIRGRELFQRLWNEPQTGDSGRLLAPGKQRLQPHADPEERLARLDVCVDRWQISRASEAGEAVPEVPYAGEDDFLESV